MNVATEARAAALQVEVKKDGLSQLQDGSWVLKLKVHPTDMPPALLTAPMGTRYAYRDENDYRAQCEKAGLVAVAKFIGKAYRL